MIKLKAIKINHDGTNNNPTNPSWGSIGQIQSRFCAVNYKDGISEMWDNKPNPRDISNLVGKIDGKIKVSKADWNVLFMTWGQFLDHDIVYTEAGTTEPVPIAIPICDPTFDISCTGTQKFSFKRS